MRRILPWLLPESVDAGDKTLFRDETDASAGSVAVVQADALPPRGYLARRFGLTAGGDRTKSALVETTDPDQVSVFRSGRTRRVRVLPTFLALRALKTRVTILLREPAPRLRLDLVREAADALHPGLRLVRSIRIQSKNKLILELKNDWDAHVFLKLPCTGAAREGLELSASVVGRLAEGLPAGHELIPLLPTTRLVAGGTDTRGWLERRCPGEALYRIDDHLRRRRALEQAGRLVAAMAELPASCLPDGDPTTERRVVLDHLREIVENHAPEQLACLEALASSLERDDGARYLRKGDFSASNLLVTREGISGVIDWDESGVTSWPMANLADLVLSLMWREGGAKRCHSLLRLLTEEPMDVLPGLGLRELIDFAGGSWREWRNGVFQSFIDHAHHGLKDRGESTFLTRARAILIDPLQALAEHDAFGS